ncbi:MDR family MFS transporter [Weissella cibaria]|uniref:MDR family MFS transporter n=1 Tax=Weissella cibaria TaxID=137591 RepID=UPI000FFE1F3D|nr:MDR family MFS transporter [Weissella cibaria]MBZ6069431.1 MFS transporter [Weissella cibaria]QAT24875.1 MFS transporter [Weissella cibaria]HJF37360.1 MFS transporter [Weissella cibaria]
MENKPKFVGIITAAILLSTFMSAVEGTVISTAMPTIIGSLHGIKLMSWVFSIYMLMTAVATPIYGKLADLIGRKPAMLSGLIIFLFGSMMSGISDSMGALIFWRAIQGIGAGGIMPVAFTILADLYPIEKRASVMGLNSTAWGVASMVGPLVGGYLVQNLSWHWVFFINVPVGLIAIGILVFFYKDRFERRKATIDYTGVLWMTMFIVGLLLGLQMISESQWLLMIVFFIMSVLGLWLFIKRERKAEEPLIDLAMFKSVDFTAANAIAGLVAGFIIAYNVYLPTWMQALGGMKPSVAGFVVTPSSVVWMFGAMIAGRVMAKHGAQYLFKFSLFIGTLYAIMLAVMPGDAPFVLFLATGVIFGLTMGSTMTGTTVMAQQTVAPSQVGMATSFNNLARAMVQTMMTTVYGVVLNVSMAIALRGHSNLKFNELNELIDPNTAKNLPASHIAPLRDIMTFGLHNIFWVGALLMIGAIATNMWATRQLKK